MIARTWHGRVPAAKADAREPFVTHYEVLAALPPGPAG